LYCVEGANAFGGDHCHGIGYRHGF